MRGNGILRSGRAPQWLRPLGCGLALATGLATFALAVPQGARAATSVPCNSSGPGGSADPTTLITDISTAASGDTLSLAAGCVYTLTKVDNSTDGPTGLPVITSTLTIDGNGATITRGAGSPAFRILDMSLATLTVDHLTLSNGDAAGTGTVFGGGISGSGTLTVTDSTLAGNAASASCAGAPCDAIGGAIVVGPTVTIAGSTFSANSASATEAACTASCTLSAEGGAIASNTAMTVVNSTFTRNTATATAPACTSSCSPFAGGGGVADIAQPASITSSTLSDNGASASAAACTTTCGSSAVGGDVFASGGAGFGTVTITDSIVANSSGGGECGVTVANQSGSILNGGDNLVFPSTTCGSFSPAVHADPVLGTLADNGGPTHTMALLSGSPAIDAGGTCPGAGGVDQRGLPRDPSACDIGAYETQVVGTTLTKTASPTLGRAPLPVTYTYQETNVGSDSISSVTLTDDRCSPVTLVSGDTNGNHVLDPGETWNFTCSTTLTTPGAVKNTATANGTDATENLTVPTETATATVTVASPHTVLTKTASTTGGEAPLPVTYTYTEKNDGADPISGVSVTDDHCSPVTLVSGDTNTNGILDPGETWNFTCSTTLTTAAAVTNTATATGTDAIDGQPAPQETATATVTVTAPHTTLTETASPTSGPAPLPVTYTYTESNDGSVPISGVSVTDDHCSPVALVSGDTNSNSILDPAETWTFTCSTTLTTPGVVTNTATATGTDTADQQAAPPETAQATVTATVPLATCDPEHPDAGSDAPGTVTGPVPLAIATLAEPRSTDHPGSSNRDEACVDDDVHATDVKVTGKLTFFLCRPSEVLAGIGCPVGAGTRVGDPQRAADDHATKSGAAKGKLTSQPGTYCWRVHFSGDANFLPSDETNTTTECFTVTHPPSARSFRSSGGGALAIAGLLMGAVVRRRRRAGSWPIG